MSVPRCKQQPRQPWLDEQTARVEVSYVVFNAQLPGDETCKEWL